mmetsp:Transcript_7931/g.16906  ORF Transcript_7931/g.16906 Transcript_7931/m.16906 type:complete len:106 (-) Transcript_7931:66-383(-)
MPSCFEWITRKNGYLAYVLMPGPVHLIKISVADQILKMNTAVQKQAECPGWQLLMPAKPIYQMQVWWGSLQYENSSWQRCLCMKCVGNSLAPVFWFQFWSPRSVS